MLRYGDKSSKMVTNFSEMSDLGFLAMITIFYPPAFLKTYMAMQETEIQRFGMLYL